LEEGVMTLTRFPSDGVYRRLLTIALAALLAFATLAITPGVSAPAHGQTSDDAPADNCGVDVVFILDASGSMGDNGSEGINAVRAGFKSFVSALASEAPASNIGVVQFGTNATTPVPYTNVEDPDLISYIDNTYEAYTSPFYWTNWDAALSTATSSFTPADGVILITDGNPTTYGDGSDREDTVVHWDFSTGEAQASATGLKAKTVGTVFGIGAGDGFTNPLPPADDPVQPIGRLTSVVDEGRVTTFDDLTSALPDIITDICEPSISIEKEASPSELPAPGGDFAFTVTVTNTSISHAGVLLTEFTDTIDGSEPVNIADISGVNCTYSDSSPYNPATDWIAADDYVECTWTTSFTGSPRSEHDTARATGIDPGQRPTAQVTDDATITITPVPGIAIEKSTNGENADSEPGPSITVGDSVTWTYVVTNTGTTDLTGVIVTDDILGDVCTIGDLAIGESEECEASGTAALGQYANVGTATDNNGDGSTVTDTDPSHYLGVAAPVPAIAIEKSTNGEDADTGTGPSVTEGDPVVWEYVVTNTGNVALTTVVVTDDILGDVCLIGDLALGESKTCQLNGTAVAGQYANVGTVTGLFVVPGIVEQAAGDQIVVSDTDPSHYFGQAVAASAEIGDTVWNDENQNGVQDNGEKGIAGAKVKLTNPDNTTLEAVTNANGKYIFAGLEAGKYTVAVILSSIPAPAEGENKLTTAGSFTIELAADEIYLDADFGIASALPKTGLSADNLALIALVLLVAGGLALLATRKRNDNGESDIAA
jgi:LPXTG-motif cell wall-anchored protein